MIKYHSLLRSLPASTFAPCNPFPIRQPERAFLNVYWITLVICSKCSREVSHRTQNKVQTLHHESSFMTSLSSSLLSSVHSVSAPLASLLFPKQIRLYPNSGPLHLLFLPPRILFPISSHGRPPLLIPHRSWSLFRCPLL